MKRKSVTLSLLFTSFTLFGVSPEYARLNAKSYAKLGLGALAGGAAGLAIAIASHMLLLKNNPNFDNQKLLYAVIPTLTALCTAVSQYLDLPEVHFNKVKAEIAKLGQHQLLISLVNKKQKSSMMIMKDYFFKERFPLACAFGELEELYDVMQTYENVIREVIMSHRKDLHTDCVAMMGMLDSYRLVLREGIKALREDPNFIAENSAQIQINIYHHAIKG